MTSNVPLHDLQGDAVTPDVVDAEVWLGLPKDLAMDAIGLRSPADYDRVRRDIEPMVTAAKQRQTQTGIHVPVVLKRKQNEQTAGLFTGGKLDRLTTSRQR